MNFSWTLSGYFARNYAVNLVCLLLGLMALIYFFDVIELIRRASKFDDVPLTLVLQLGLLKLPEVTQILFPFAVLFSAIFTFWSLTQRLELIVVRSSGFSSLHFLSPIVLVAIITGFLQMGVLNPFGAYLLSHYERLEAIHLKRQSNQVVLFENGLWLRQDMENGHAILHSERITQPDWQLQNVSGFFFDLDGNFQDRLDAPSGTLLDGEWVFKDVILHSRFSEKQFFDTFSLNTQLTADDVEDSFVSAETIAFWQLPGHIHMLNASGFNVNKLQVYYHSLLAQPLMFAAMVFIAAAVSMRLPRSGSALLYIAFGVAIGLVIYFLSSFMQALGASQQIPIFFAAWAPAFISLLFGLSGILNQEEA